MSYIPSRKASQALGVHPNTLRKWDKEGKIKVLRAPSGQRLYDISSMQSSGRAKLCYARVSSRNQKEDLENQIAFLRNRYPNYEIVTDIGSGLNFKRKGFLAILERIMRGEIEELVVAHRDRLCRFGFELIECIACQNNARIVVLDETRLSPQEELTRDLISIIHVFSCRIYGLRKYTTQMSKDKDLPGKGQPDKDETISGPE